MISVALKGLAGRKFRATLTAFAIVLGVAMVSGTFVLTDTIDKAFNAIFTESYAETDAVVSGRAPGIEFQGIQAEAPGVPESLLARVRETSGVEAAAGFVLDDTAAKILDRKGKAINTNGAPALGFGVSSAPGDLRFNPLNLLEGRWPSARNEVVIDANTADDQGYEIGDRVGVASLKPVERFLLVGTAKYGNVESLGTATFAVFDLPTAQELFEREGEFSAISVAAEDGLGAEELVRRLDDALPRTVKVQTGVEQATEESETVAEFTTFIRYFLLAFGGIALFVGAFVIFNTLSITVAQRTREFATLRTIGASRRQVLGSVIVEALVIGALASVVGLFLGFALARGLNALFDALGLGLPTTAMVYATRTFVVSLLVGIVVTLLAGLAPAVRATRVPPIAAVREGATLPRSRFAPYQPYAAAAVIAVSLALLFYAMFADDLDTGPRLLSIAAGTLALFVGVGLLSSKLVRPLAVWVTPVARGAVTVLGVVFYPFVVSFRFASRAGHEPALQGRRRLVLALLGAGVALLYGAAAALVGSVANVLPDVIGVPGVAVAASAGVAAALALLAALVGVPAARVARSRLRWGALVAALVVAVALAVVQPLTIPVVLAIAVAVALLLAMPVAELPGLVPEASGVRLARENARRNPGRTAATAAALMIGLALVTFIATLSDGMKASNREAIEDQIVADYVVTAQDGFSPFVAAAGEAVGRAGEESTDVRSDLAKAAGKDRYLTGIEPGAILQGYRFDWVEGSNAVLSRLGRTGAIVDKDFAEEVGLAVGERFPVVVPSGERLQLTVKAIYAPPPFYPLLGSVSIPKDTFDTLYERQRNQFTFVNVPGEPTAATKKQLERAAATFPDAKVQTREEWITQQDEDFNQFLMMLYVLLALSVIVSLFGMINTLVLSVFERTRELGMLRAVGMERLQVRRMIRQESVITALIGAALGLPLGIFLAALVTRALSEFEVRFSIPVTLLEIFAIVAIVAGIVAAIIPARRAARLNVLNALQYE